MDNFKVHDLVIVSCGGSKIQDREDILTPPIPVKNVYTSGYFKQNRQYAEKFGKQWCILSAHYGFMAPDWLMPRLYNATWSKSAMRKMEKEGKKISPSMSCEALRRQALHGHPIKFLPGMEIVVLSGKEYAQRVKFALDSIKDMRILNPLDGLGIGKQIQKVKNAVERNRSFK